MRLERLIVHNFMSITHVDLDLTTLPPGIVAFTGPYGAGKTTLLEAPIAALLRKLSSRKDDLKEFATGRDTSLEAWYAVAGGTYRAVVSIDQVSGKSNATLSLDGTLLNDGKVTTFDQVVRERFPSQDVLLAAAIATQNKRGNFVGKEPKEKAELFIELLALKRLLQMSETAKANAAAVEQKRLSLQITLVEIARTIGSDTLDALDRAIAEADDQAALLRRGHEVVLGLIADLERDLAAKREIVTAHAAASERLASYRALMASGRRELAEIAADIERLNTEAEAALALADERAARERTLAISRRADALARVDEKAAADTAAALATASAICRENTARIAKNQQVLDQATAIRTAVASLADLSIKAAEVRAAIEAKRDEQQAVNREHSKVAERLATLHLVEQQLTTAQKNAALLTRVPFGDKCADAQCEFVVNAASAKRSIPTFEQKLSVKPDLDQRVEALNASYQTLAAAIAELAKDGTRLQTETERQRALAQLSDALAAAEAKIAGYEASNAQAEQDATERIAAIEADRVLALTHVEADLTARVAHIEAERITARATITTNAAAAGARATARQLAVDTEIGELTVALEKAGAEIARTSSGHDESVAIAADLSIARVDERRYAVELATCASRGAELGRRRADLSGARARQATLQATLAVLDQELVEWQQLQQALGRDGIPMLEIDSAGPLISQTTNELVAAAFGTQFSVELVTQQAKADGGLKDAFDLLVYDNERGGAQRKVANLSGGEQVIVSEALMNALAIYTNEHSPMRLETIWRDETVGALNAEARAQYFQMLRKVHDLGHYHHIFIVTHDEDIAGLCDAQIRVDKATGTAVVATAPYSQAA